MASKVSNTGAVLTLYMSYFVYAMGLIFAGQLSDPLAAQWGVEAKDVIAAFAWMAIGKVASYPFAGAISDRIGRKTSVLIGLSCNAAFFLLIPMSPNATIGTLIALIFGIGNSFLDAGTYPTLMESNPNNASTMNILIKLFISGGQFLMPVLVTAAGTNWKIVPYLAGAYMVVMTILTLLSRYPDFKAIGAKQAEQIKAAEAVADDNTKKVRFAFEGVVCLIFIFCTNGTVYLANQALPKIGEAVAGLSNEVARGLTQPFAIGSITAVVLTAILSSKIKSIHFVPVYATMGLVSVGLLNMPFMQNITGMRIAAFCIGYFVSGGIMQLVLTALSDFFPKAKGKMVSWYWMAGSVGGFILPYVVKIIVPSTDGMSDEAAKEALASGYGNVVWLAVAFSAVALVAAIVVYFRHVSLFGRSKHDAVMPEPTTAVDVEAATAADSLASTTVEEIE